jgi:hypothetical protein
MCLADRWRASTLASFGAICKNFCNGLTLIIIATRNYTLLASNSSNYAESALTSKDGPKPPWENPARSMLDRCAIDKNPRKVAAKLPRSRRASRRVPGAVSISLGNSGLGSADSRLQDLGCFAVQRSTFAAQRIFVRQCANAAPSGRPCWRHFPPYKVFLDTLMGQSIGRRIVRCEERMRLMMKIATSRL